RKPTSARSRIFARLTAFSNPSGRRPYPEETRKAPAKGAWFEWNHHFVGSLSRARELAAFRFLETGLLAFRLQLAQHGGVQGGRRGLAPRAGPVALRGHDLDEPRAAHGLLGFLQDPDRCIQGAELLRGRGGGSLLGALGLGGLGRFLLVGRLLR